MSGYPILLDSRKIKALVIGAGEVGLRKIKSLLMQEVGAIDVYDIGIAFEDFKYKDEKAVSYCQKAFDINLIEKYNLVFIASNDWEKNSFYALECEKRKIFCNVISNPQEGSFSLPALIHRDDLLLTLSTNGQSPALTKALKAELENFLDSPQNNYTSLCAFLGKLRPQILELGLETKQNTEIFRTFVISPYKEVFIEYFSDSCEKNREKVEKCLEKCFTKEVQDIVKKNLKDFICSHYSS